MLSIVGKFGLSFTLIELISTISLQDALRKRGIGLLFTVPAAELNGGRNE